MQNLHVSCSQVITTSSRPVLIHCDSENDKWKTWTNYPGCNTRIREHIMEDHYERYITDVKANGLKEYTPSNPKRSAKMKTLGCPPTELFTKDGAVSRLKKCVDLSTNVCGRLCVSNPWHQPKWPALDFRPFRPSRVPAVPTLHVTESNFSH